jgi:RNA polymerase sigma factor (sigma-70 family)
MAKAVSNPLIQLVRRTAEDGCVRALPDHELLQRFHARQDQAAFDALLHRHGPMVLDVCRSVLGNEADVEDAFQATFLVLARKAGSIRNATSLGSWLHGVAYRGALKARVRLVTRRKHEAGVPVRAPSEPDDLSWREVRRVLHEELNRLSERYRVPLVLCYLEGKTQDQAADELGLAKSTLRERAERGRELLRARLVRRGLAPTALLAAAAWPAANASAGIPMPLMTSTLQAASLFAAGPADTVAISANAAALTQGVLRTMLLSKIKTATALALVLFACVGGALAWLPRGAAQDETARKTEETEGRNAAQETDAAPRAAFPDLTKIDRTIVKEPRYTTQPYYALLAIGPEAKKRVWLVVDGETLYVDRNGNGDLTEPNNRVAKDKIYEVAPGLYKQMDSFDIGELEGLRLRLDFWVRHKDFVPYTNSDKRLLKDHEANGWESATLFRVDANGKSSPQIPITFCRRPQDAQVCHLAGPLTPYLVWGDVVRRDADQHFLEVSFGTPGLPVRNSVDPLAAAFWTRRPFAPVGTSEMPAGAHPVAHFEFPHKDPKRPPINLDVVLDQQCCGDRFYGPVRVPVDAARGKARVTVSFPAWKEGNVIPATFEVGFDEVTVQERARDRHRDPYQIAQHQPDWLPLGTVCVGATIEASFVVFAKADDPKKVALRVWAPPFVKVLNKSVIEREYYDGANTVKGVAAIVVVGIDTRKAGNFQGQVEVEVEAASAEIPVTAKVPVAVVVRPPEPGALRMLVVESPFTAFSTGDPSGFKDWTDLVTEAGWNVSYLTVAEGKPLFRDLDLSKFDVVLLAPDGRTEDAADVKRVRAFVEGGGRLVVSAQSALVGSVEAANKVIEGYGLKMLPEEAPIGRDRLIPAAVLDEKALAPEVVKAGIKSARFFRASPIVVSTDKPARVLVKAAGVGGPEDGFVATAKAGKGEVVVLSKSMWWYWMTAEEAKGTDNAKLLRLLLTPTAGDIKTKKD